jgi:hypothetical protein
MEHTVMIPAGCIIVALVLLAPGAATAGKVQKCVDKDGNVTFSDTICPEAASVEAQPDAAPTPDAAAIPATPSPAEAPPRGGYGDFIDRGREAEQDSRKHEPAPDAGG